MAPIRIALVIKYDLAYCREVLHGIKRYALAKPHWIFLPAHADPRAVKALRSSAPDGVIAQVFSRALSSAFTALNRPLVNISRALANLPWPRVGADEALVAQLVANHLLERGLRHFGFVGHPAYGYAAQREEGFRRTLAGAGCTLSCFHTTAEMPTISRMRPWSSNRKIQQWLLALPKPVGVFASNDQSGVCADERVGRHDHFVARLQPHLRFILDRFATSEADVPP